MENKYDVIVIGSGMGGLACASLFSKLENKRVLILERHFTPGGFTHGFRRKKKYEWDVGVHYVGEMNKGSHYRALFDFVTDDQVEWQAMPEKFDQFVYPDLRFAARVGIRRFRQDLIDKFPAESAAISTYFEDLMAASRWYGRHMIGKLLPVWLQPLWRLMNRIGRAKALTTTQDYLDQQFKDQKLKAVLLSQWGNAGLPPSQSAFAAHSVIACHYLDGGYYPVGGAKSIAQTVNSIVERTGGKILTKYRVNQIIVENGKAVGVRASTRAKGREQVVQFFADTIVSNVGAYITYDQLLPKDYPLSFRPELELLANGSFHVCAYLGFKESPKKLGFRGENYWIYSSYDHNDAFSKRNKVLDGKISGCFLSFPSLKNPESEGHTAELISFIGHEPFQQWSPQRWRKRGKDYQVLKQKIAQDLIQFVNSQFPGFEDLVEFCEVSTPLSTANFTGHKNGCIYGLPCVPDKFTADWLSPRTPIDNLYLTGSDISGHGVVGALMGGAMTTLVASRNKWPLIKLMVSTQRLSRHPEKRDVLLESTV